MRTYDPEKWLESTLHSLEDFVTERIIDLDATSTDNFNELYEITMDFPGATLDSRSQLVPLTRAIIHFALDDVVESPLGIGSLIFADNYDADTGYNFPQEAGVVILNFDVGIWTSDRTGGTSARAFIRQMLSEILRGPAAQQRFLAESDGGDGGIEIVSFSGGRFTTDKVNDVLVYRTIDTTLELRVFSRTQKPTSGVVAIDEISQSQGLTSLG
jgi:hypothetical protein